MSKDCEECSERKRQEGESIHDFPKPTDQDAYYDLYVFAEGLSERLERLHYMYMDLLLGSKDPIEEAEGEGTG